MSLYIAGLVGAVLSTLPAFDFVDSLGHVHGDGANLRVWHEALRSEYTAETTYDSHHVRGSYNYIKVEPTLHNLICVVPCRLHSQRLQP